MPKSSRKGKAPSQNSLQRDLLAACQKNDLSSAKSLVNTKADVIFVHNGLTALGSVAYSSDPASSQLVAFLLQAKAKVNHPDDQCDPLYNAVTENDVASVKLLLDAGARTDIVSSKNRDAAIHQAVSVSCGSTADISTVDLLIDAKCNVDFMVGLSNTPLMIAAAKNNLRAVQSLIKAGAAIDMEAEWGRTALQMAATSGHYDIAMELINARANVNTRDNSCAAPITEAASNGHGKIVDALICAGAKVNITENHVYRSFGEDDEYPLSPLGAAVENGHADIVTSLLEARASVNTPGGGLGYLPVQMVAETHHVAVVYALAAGGANFNAMAGQGECPSRQVPLTLAIRERDGTEEMVRALLRVGASTEVEDGRIPPLHAAVHAENINMIEMVLMAGADIDEKVETMNMTDFDWDEQGMEYDYEREESWRDSSAILAAVLNERLDIVNMLIEAGADVNLCYGMPSVSLLDISKSLEGFSTDIVDALVDAGALSTDEILNRK